MLEQPAAGQEADERDPQRRGWLAVVAVLGLCAVGIALAYNQSLAPFLKGGFSLSTSFNNTVKRSASPSQNLFYMEPLIMNARDIDAASFVRLTLTLELEHPDVADTVKAHLGAIQNAVIVAAASRDSTVLRSAKGKILLRDELTRTINALLPKGGVRAVYFADFLIR